MRPRPMNPQVAKLVPLKEKNLFVVNVDTEARVPAFHVVLNFGDENWVEIRAFMLILQFQELFVKRRS